jgi:hypothetical protein
MIFPYHSPSAAARMSVCLYQRDSHATLQHPTGIPDFRATLLPRPDKTIEGLNRTPDCYNNDSSRQQAIYQ